MTAPLVSAVVDTYNQERYVEQALVSVLEQGLSPSELEIVVIDDGSTDNTPSIIQKFIPRVRYLRKKNGGQASAFNAAIPETHAPIVAFLDADDWWATGKLRAVLDTFEKNPGIAAVGHGFFEVRGDEIPDEFVVPRQTCRIDLSGMNAARQAADGRLFLGTSRLAVRREALDRIGRIPEELVFCADTPILTCALALGGAMLIDQPLCYYRLHSGNLFALKSDDVGKVRRRYDITRCNLTLLPQRLLQFDVDPEIVAAFFERDRIGAEHFLLRTDGGSWLTTFRTQMRSFRSEYKNPSLGYILFRWSAGAMALLMPARRFYQVWDWCARRNLGRVRDLLGNAELVHPQSFIQRRRIEPERLGNLSSPEPIVESGNKTGVAVSARIDAGYSDKA